MDVKMPRSIRDNPKIRLNLDFSEVVKAQIEDIRDRTDAASMSEVLRRALSLYDAVLAAQGQGSAVIIRDAEGVERHILLV
jgi:hypothetical protein